MGKPKVYFTKEITSESLVKMYELLNKELTGKVGVKISTGEMGNNNHLDPNLIKDLVNKINGTIVECNTAYVGKRMDSKEHLETAKVHGFTDIADVDIMDSEGEISIPIKKGKHLKENFVGSHLANYDSMLVLSHFKGNAMGGYGGALKNISIGIASSEGKVWIHTAGKIKEVDKIWKEKAEQDIFLECMTEAASSVIDYMNNNMLYINVINNLSVDCDCDSTPSPVCMKDIGITASIDPVAVDKASVDLIYASNDEGRNHMIERIESRNGIHTINYAEELGLGSTDYELINVD